MKRKLILPVITIASALVFLSGCTSDESKLIGMPNPWTDCGKSLSCAAKAAGFTFPLDLKNIKVRAMKDMIEIQYPLDNVREITVRKTTEDLYNSTDISGDYNNYPITDTLVLDNGVQFKVRRDENKIYVAYFGAEQGFYSINCTEGFSKAELQTIYDAIASVEAPKGFPEK